jgi:hypothetical protein
MIVYAVRQCQHDSRRSAYDGYIRGGLEDTHRCYGFRVSDFIFHDLCTVAYYKERLSLRIPSFT